MILVKSDDPNETPSGARGLWARTRAMFCRTADVANICCPSRCTARGGA